MVPALSLSVLILLCGADTSEDCTRWYLCAAPLIMHGATQVSPRGNLLELIWSYVFIKMSMYLLEIYHVRSNQDEIRNLLVVQAKYRIALEDHRSRK